MGLTSPADTLVAPQPRGIVDPRTGLPLDVGDRYRVAPPWIRKALWARDRTLPLARL